MHNNKKKAVVMGRKSAVLSDILAHFWNVKRG